MPEVRARIVIEISTQESNGRKVANIVVRESGTEAEEQQARVDGGRWGAADEWKGVRASVLPLCRGGLIVRVMEKEEEGWGGVVR